jgi:16S rRNA G1207 methylase RsmC
MLSPFFANDKNLHLERFPPAQVNRSLQAWDSADEYLIDHLALQQLISPNANILIFNDNFGALAINFIGYTTYCISDSYLSHAGSQHNIELNGLESPQIHYLTSLDSLPNNIDIILYKIPKSKSLLTQQLIDIKNQLNKDVTFIAAAKAKDIHSSTLKLFEKYLGTTTTSLAVKKSRLVFSKLDNNINNHSPFPTTWPLELPSQKNSHFKLSNHANVFAREKLDLGARFFIEHLPKIKAEQTLIDLGCGNGVVGLTVLTEQPSCRVIFTDESYMAVASAQLNIKNNLPENLAQCQFYVDDCLSKVDNDSIDIILCNPPFHQQQATTDHIAWQMFNNSFLALKKGGELRIIGNRQLGYHIKLQRIFGNAETIASNKKFVILSAIKQ